MLTLVDSLDQIPQLSDAYVLTIGNFDGIHLGHQAILKRLVEIGQQTELPTAALTFRNHPSEILRPDALVSLLCTSNERYEMLEHRGVTQVIALPFSAQLAQLNAEQFLAQLRDRIPFGYLVLGHDATIGKGRAGNREVVEKLAERNGFQVYYEPALKVEGQVVSSSVIREAIRQGRLHEAAQWLGRPYSLSGPVIPGRGQGQKMGFPTINVDVSRLCLPPFGVYSVTLLAGEHTYRGIANIGLAPTIREGGVPLLEVHLYQSPVENVSGWVKVTLIDFVRPEQRFESVEALKAQIAKDVERTNGR